MVANIYGGLTMCRVLHGAHRRLTQALESEDSYEPDFTEEEMGSDE